MKPTKTCQNCPHLLQRDFEGRPYWRCNRPKEPTGRPRGRPNERGHAAQIWLQKYLESGPKPSGDWGKPQPDTVFGEGFLLGFKYGTIRRAADKLAVCKYRDTNSKFWFWSLP